jgi:hypothetical protein
LGLGTVRISDLPYLRTPSHKQHIILTSVEFLFPFLSCKVRRSKPIKSKYNMQLISCTWAPCTQSLWVIIWKEWLFDDTSLHCTSYGLFDDSQLQKYSLAQSTALHCTALPCTCFLCNWNQCHFAMATQVEKTPLVSSHKTLQCIPFNNILIMIQVVTKTIGFPLLCASHCQIARIKCQESKSTTSRI